MAPQCRQQHAFRQELPHQAAISRSQGAADGNLALPGRRPRQQEARKIGARQQQHQSHDAHQDRQRFEELIAQAV